MEDTSFLYGDSPNMDEDADSGDSEMANALMDALQVVGVDPLLATRFTCAIIKKQKASLMELYGRGSLVHGANVSHTNLNSCGLDALDLRSRKPSGEPWDFTRPADRKLALWLVRTRKPTWVIGAPPCTAFSRLQGLNFHRMPKSKVDAILKEGRLHLHFMLQI